MLTNHYSVGTSSSIIMLREPLEAWSLSPALHQHFTLLSKRNHACKLMEFWRRRIHRDQLSPWKTWENSPIRISCRSFRGRILCSWPALWELCPRLEVLRLRKSAEKVLVEQIVLKILIWFHLWSNQSPGFWKTDTLIQFLFSPASTLFTSGQTESLVICFISSIPWEIPIGTNHNCSTNLAEHFVENNF